MYAENKKDLILIELTSPINFESEPRKIITRTFRVTNNSENEESFYEEIYLPEKWQVIGQNIVIFKLKPGESQIRLFTFFIPIFVFSGNYEITYFVANQRNYEINNNSKFTINVLPLHKLEMLIEDKPSIIIAGQSFYAKLRLINRGNSTSKITLSFEGHPDYPIKIESNIINIDPGTSKVVNFEIFTDKNLNKKIKYLLNIQAFTSKIGTEIKILSDQKTIDVDIMPTITGEIDPYHRINTKMLLLGISENNKYGYQTQLSGGGSLDEEGEKKIEFSFKQPKPEKEIIAGEKEEAFINYNDKIYNLSLGASNYSISYLLEYNKFGNGVEIGFKPSNFKIGALNLKSKIVNPEEKETGTYIQYLFSDKLEIKANFLNKKNDLYNNDIYSLQMLLKSNEHLNIDLELASNSYDEEKKHKDRAHRINVTGEFPKISYNYVKTYAGPHFFGYYNDYDASSGRIFFSLSEKLQGNFSFDFYKNNLDSDLLKNQYSANEKNYKSGVAYILPSDLNISIDYTKLTNKDELLPVNFDYEENSIKLGLKQDFNYIGINTYLERGIYENYLLDIVNDDLEKYSVFTYIKPGSGQVYSIFGNIGTDNFAGSSLKSKSAGISGSWQIGRVLYLRLEYQKNNFDSDPLEEQNYLFSYFNYILPNSHILSLRSTWSKNEDNKDNFLAYLSYSMNFGIPIKKKKSIGAISGKIYNAERPDKTPIPNVLLSINELSAVSDKNGEFILPSLSPGIYYLWVERIFIGLNSITTEKLPIAVNVKPGETTKIEIGITTSAKIFGKVAVFAPNIENGVNYSEKTSFLIEQNKISNTSYDSGNFKAVRSVGNIPVELTNGQDFLQDVTDEKGEFNFKDLRPGKWLLKISDKNLPEHHYLEQKEIQFELKPNEIKDISIKIFPRLRQIRIIDEGNIKQENN